MKMREELELYKGKAADAELHILNLNIEHDDNVSAVHAMYKDQIASIETALNKKLMDKTNSEEYRRTERDKLQDQVTQLHDILDVIPGAVARKKVDANGYDNGENACHVRLASVLAQKFM